METASAHLTSELAATGQQAAETIRRGLEGGLDGLRDRIVETLSGIGDAAAGMETRMLRVGDAFTTRLDSALETIGTAAPACEDMTRGLSLQAARLGDAGAALAAASQEIMEAAREVNATMTRLERATSGVVDAQNSIAATLSTQRQTTSQPG